MALLIPGTATWHLLRWYASYGTKLQEMTYEEPDGWRYTSAINNPNSDRFRHMATLVLRLNHSNSAPWEGTGSSKINIDAIQAAFSWFTSQTSSDTLLPRVKTISWDTHESYPSSQVPYFISSCLQRFSFTRTGGWIVESGGDLECVIDIFKSLIKNRCQLIRLSLHFAWKFTEPASLQAEFLEFASTQTQLRSIKIRDWINEPLLRGVVSTQDTLMALGCWVYHEVGVTFGHMMDTLSTGFRVLRELDVGVTGHGVTDESFKQLLRVRSLRRVALNVLSFPRLGEADVEAMSQAWPNVEKFTVKLRWSLPRTLQPLSILSAFAECMGSTIQILGLDLDATAELPLGTVDSIKFVKLRELRIGRLSPAPHDPEDGVAEYLQSLSQCGQPSFKLVVPNNTPERVNGNPSSLKGWQKVRYLLETGGVAAEEGSRS